MECEQKNISTGTEDSTARIANIDQKLEALDQKETAAICNNGAAIPWNGFKLVDSITAAELDKLDIPPIEWLVKDLLPVGLAMISAPPKYYKSFLCLDLCVSVCSGSPFLEHETMKNDCLYLDLESTRRRPQDRLNKICGKDHEKPSNLFIITGDQNVGFIGRGFEAQILNQLEDHPQIKLVVVDVLQLIRPEGKKLQTGYDRDYADFHALKKLADDHEICILLVNHNRKMKDPSDPFNEISGSAGTMGALDCAWTITKEDRYDDEAVMNVTGRDLESQQFKIRYDKDYFRWVYVGTTDDLKKQEEHFRYVNNSIIQTIKQLVGINHGHWEGTAQEIKNASMFTDHKIFDDPRQIGTKITEYEGLLSLDGIQHLYDPYTHRGRRLHIFDKVDVDDVVDDVDDVDVADVAGH